MSERKPELLLQDILESARKIIEYTQNLIFDQFVSDSKTIDAVIRNFEIIGEAAGRLPKEYKDLHPEINWLRMKGFRNRIVHDYFGVDYKIVWKIIQGDVPQLIESIEKLLK
jgi:uncharacterized protein with HEPN domain